MQSRSVGNAWVAAGVAALLLLAGCGADQPPQDIAPPPVAAVAAPAPSEEVMLATIELGALPAGDERVADYGHMLDAVQKKYPGTTRRQASNVLVVAQKQLREKGVRESLLDLGWHIDQAAPERTGSAKQLVDVTAAYVTLRTLNR